jgi:alkylation response protein AidB-like acyl-CoA dehydrogenase
LAYDARSRGISPLFPQRDEAFTMDFSYSKQEQAFRDEVRAWIDATIPGDFGSEYWPAPEDEDQYDKVARDWQQKMYDGGWIGIDWPEEYGGRSLSPVESFIFQE